MLRQRPSNVNNQSSLFIKKQKKRSTSTSRNKENISISHNQSYSIDYSKNQDKNQANNKTIKVGNKQKPKKQKLTQTAKQRSASRNSNQTSTVRNFTQENITNFQHKQVQSMLKKPKVRNIDVNQQHFKSQIIHEANYQIDCYKNLKKPLKQKQTNEVILSKTSTIISASTGNIQFSDRSKDEQKLKIFQLPKQNYFDSIQLSSKHNRKWPQQSFSFQSRSKRLNPNRAAIMIQKTWRGYLTRKLLEQYIESFEPMYEQQLKQIRSSRQSCHEIKFSNKRQQKEKSLFFDQQGLDQCSEIIVIGSEEKKMKVQTNIKRNNVNNGDMPLQVSNKNGSKSLINEKLSSTQRSVKSNQLKQSCKNNSNQFINQRISQNDNKVSEFTVKNSLDTNNKLQSFREQTTKVTNKRQATFYIHNAYSETINNNISSPCNNEFNSLQFHCLQLQNLFSVLNTECISTLKKQIKGNKMNLSELIQRKQALKDIVQNGKQFVRNVLQEMTKAFEQMRRITVDGCVSQSQECSVESTQRNAKNGQQSNKQQSLQSKSIPQSPCISSSSNTTHNHKQHINITQSIQKRKKSTLHYNHNNVQQQQQPFYKIQLPTEQYSIKKHSPIQQQYNQQYSSSDEDDHQSDQQQQQQQQKQDQQVNNQDTQSFDASQSQSTETNYYIQPIHQQSIQILNQFLINLIDEFNQLSQTKDISELQYLCQTLKRVSCDTQNKTIIDRCLIQFIVEIMSETYTLTEIYQAFKTIVVDNVRYCQSNRQKNQEIHLNDDNNDNWKLYQTIRRWLDELQKWQMNIIKEVPSKMQSSSFLNTAQNISFSQLRQFTDSSQQSQKITPRQQREKQIKLY